MGQQRILIVEDSPTMRQLLVFSLRRLKNVEIVEAQDGMDGLRKVSGDHFDIALIDINMPVMDGLKLIRLMRSEETLKDIPIVVITTEGSQQRVEAFMDGGAADYIKKPFTPEEVRRKLNRIMGETSDGEGDAAESNEGLDF